MEHARGGGVLADGVLVLAQRPGDDPQVVGRRRLARRVADRAIERLGLGEPPARLAVLAAVLGHPREHLQRPRLLPYVAGCARRAGRPGEVGVLLADLGQAALVGQSLGQLAEQREVAALRLAIGQNVEGAQPAAHCCIAAIQVIVREGIERLGTPAHRRLKRAGGQRLLAGAQRVAGDRRLVAGLLGMVQQRRHIAGRPALQRRQRPPVQFAPLRGRDVGVGAGPQGVVGEAVAIRLDQEQPGLFQLGQFRRCGTKRLPQRVREAIP